MFSNACAAATARATVATAPSTTATGHGFQSEMSQVSMSAPTMPIAIGAVSRPTKRLFADTPRLYKADQIGSAESVHA